MLLLAKKTMKKFLFIACLVSVFACSKGKNDQPEQSSENEKERVDEYSRRNVTPQLDYDTTNNPSVDTVSSAQGEKRQEK